MWIVGVILLLVAVGLAFGARLQRAKRFAMQSTETALAKDLVELANKVASEIGGGAFCERAEVKGRIGCDAPLTSELEKVQCVHYEMRVDQQYEETYWETDAQGRRQPRTRRGSERVAQNKRSVPFFVEDSSGRIEVAPDGADFVAGLVG